MPLKTMPFYLEFGMSKFSRYGYKRTLVKSWFKMKQCECEELLKMGIIFEEKQS
jgi:hypothetical protein